MHEATKSVKRKRTFCGLVIINFINSSRPSSNFLGVLVAHFSKTIGWMMVWSRFYMCYAIEFHECFNLSLAKTVLLSETITSGMPWVGGISANSDFGKRRPIFAAKFLQQNWSSQISFGSKSGSGDHFDRLFCHIWSSQTNFSGDKFWCP